MRKLNHLGLARLVRSVVSHITAVVTISVLTVCAGAVQRAGKTPLEWATVLVRELRPEDTSYQHKNDYVKWKDEAGSRKYESHTDCSGFLTALLERSYGFTQSDLERWLGKRRPLAIDYHDAILNQRGFKHIQRVSDVEPGDVLAIKYPPDADNSGHIMLVAEPPRRAKSTKPEIQGTEQWEVAVIDSSKSGHGKTDTRRRDDGTFGSGVGEGVFRIYANRDGRIAGYAWSTFANSEYYDERQRHLVVGRMDSHFKP